MTVALETEMNLAFKNAYIVQDDVFEAFREGYLTAMTRYKAAPSPSTLEEPLTPEEERIRDALYPQD